MKPVVLERAGGDRLLLWLACLLAIALGYYVAFYRLGADIDAQHDLNAQVTSIARANSAIVATRPQLERTEHALDQSVRALDLNADHATSVARFIRVCARSATLRHTNVTQIDERRTGATPVQPAPATGAEQPFDVIPLDVTLTGSYRNLLDTIRDLAQSPIALQIEIAAVDRATVADNAPPAALTARLHVSLERLSNETFTSSATLLTPGEPRHARSL